MLLFLAGAGIAAMGWWLMKEGEIAVWAGSLWVAIFGFLAMMIPVNAFLGKASLKLYAEGFTLRGLFAQQRYRWENVHSIRVMECLHTKLVSVEIDKKALSPKTRLLTSNKCRSTFNLPIPTSVFLVIPKDLANMMNTWRDAALGLNDQGGHVRAITDQPLPRQ